MFAITAEITGIISLIGAVIIFVLARFDINL